MTNLRNASRVMLICGLCAVAALPVGTANAPAPASSSDIPVVAPGQSLTRLSDGDWLLLGGVGTTGKASSDALIVDDVSQDHRPVAQKLNFARSGQSATVVPDGTVLVTGGVGTSGQPISDIERYHPDTQSFENLGDAGLPARAGQTATLLSDGTLLIVGGADGSSLVHGDALLFDPDRLQDTGSSASLAQPRTGHQARLLPTGDVLIWGGRSQNGEPVTTAEVYDAATARFESLDSATAASLIGKNYATVVPAVALSTPQSNAVGVSANARVILRFSEPLRPETVTDETVTLLGPGGAIAASVVSAEGGLLAFVTPKQPLLPASSYTLFVKGASDASQRPLPFTAIAFTTASIAASRPQAAQAAAGGPQAQVQQPQAAIGPKEAKPSTPAPATQVATVSVTPPPPAQSQEPPPKGNPSDVVPSDSDGELWLPGKNNLHGVWRSGLERHPSIARNLPKAPAGITAVSGIVLRLHGQPLPNVTLSIGTQKVVTDAEGKFLLSNAPTGPQTLVIDGATANAGGRQYGRYEYLASVEAGKTNALPFIIWMTRLDTRNATNLPSPTTAETVATNPRIPGLELHIPAGTVIRDSQGKNVTQITITAVPVDQPPFPLPNHWVPVYFTIQPGGAHLQGLTVNTSVGARLIYPNFSNAPAGERIDFWNYDPVVKGWYVYGQGAVSADRKQIIPDPGVVIYEFTGAMVALPADAPATGPVPNGCNGGGASGGPNAAAERADPVDCFTGLYTLNRTDLYVRDVIPLVVQRSYRPLDSSSRGFGLGANLSYDMYIVGSTNPWTYVNLILPDGSSIYYPRTSPGTSYNTAVYQTQTPGPYFGSTISYSGSSASYYWVLQLPNGTKIGFPEAEGQSNARCGAVTGITDRYGNALTFIRSSSTCNLSSVSSPNGHKLSFTYDSTNRITQVSDDSGRTVSYTYNSSGTLATATDPAGKAETYGYDSSNRLQTITDKRGNLVLTNVYDSNTRVTQQTYADNSTSSLSYTTNGNGITTQTNYTDERGNVEQIQFNTAGYPTSITRAAGTSIAQTTTFVRNATTNLAQSMTDALGRTTAYQYNSFGDVTQLTYLSGTGGAATWNYAYTAAFEELASITDPANRTTNFAYDSAGNLVTATDAVGDIITFAHNAVGQVTAVTRNVGATQLTTTLTYNSGVLSSITDPLNRKSVIFNDALGRPVTFQDPLGNQSHLTYNSLDAVTQSIDPLGNLTQLGYDANQNLLTSTDPNNVTQTYTYDPRNRQHTYQDPAGKAATYNYDGASNLTSALDRKSQTTSVTYDALNRPTLVAYQDGSTLAITWDAGNRSTQFMDSLNGTISRTYDLLDRLTQETTPQGQVSYTYDAGNRRQTMTVTGQSVVNYTFDNANRLTQVTQGTQSVTFGYDTANRRTSITLPNGIVGTFAFDNADELTAITYMNGSTQVGNLTYTYDADGRRASVGGSLAALVAPSAVSSTYDGTNRLMNYGGTALTYDADGNVTGFGSTTYTWNARNQLTATSAGSAIFAYDALGRRVSTTVNSSTTPFLYDGLNPVMMAGNMLLASGNLDEIYALLGSSSTTSYLRDGLNSTVALTSGTGSISGSYSYDPYGNTTSSGSTTTSLQYTGRENDGATGLYYYRARYYSPQLGRFISEDPIGLTGGTNFYAYVRNAPTNFIDPLGELGIGVSGGGAVEGGVVVAGAGAQGSLGLGGFIDTNNGNVSAGAYASGGAFAGGPGWGASAPSQPGSGNWALGAYAGGGGSVWVSNANNVCDLSGPFKTYSFNAAWGLRALSLQLSVGTNAAGNKIVVFNYGGPLPLLPVTGGGFGVSASAYNTNTVTTGCGCK
jgi:RHS repeat-associated protein